MLQKVLKECIINHFCIDFILIKVVQIFDGVN